VPPHSQPASVKHFTNAGVNFGDWFNWFSKALTSIATAQLCKLSELKPRFERIIKHPSHVFNSCANPRSITLRSDFSSIGWKSLLTNIFLGNPIVPTAENLTWLKAFLISVSTSQTIKFLDWVDNKLGSWARKDGMHFQIGKI